MKMSPQRLAVLSELEAVESITRFDLATILCEKYSKVFRTFGQAYGTIQNTLNYGLACDPEGPRGKYIELADAGRRALAREHALTASIKRV